VFLNIGKGFFSVKPKTTQRHGESKTRRACKTMWPNVDAAAGFYKALRFPSECVHTGDSFGYTHGFFLTFFF